MPVKNWIGVGMVAALLLGTVAVADVLKIGESGAQVVQRDDRPVRGMSQKQVIKTFGEPQLNPKAAYVVADEIGGKVLFLDPIGSPEQEDRSTYLKLMRYNLGIMKQGMGNG